jgi:hypothetical protein
MHVPSSHITDNTAVTHVAMHPEATHLLPNRDASDESLLQALEAGDVNTASVLEGAVTTAVDLEEGEVRLTTRTTITQSVRNLLLRTLPTSVGEEAWHEVTAKPFIDPESGR